MADWILAFATMEAVRSQICHENTYLPRLAACRHEFLRCLVLPSILNDPIRIYLNAG